MVGQDRLRRLAVAGVARSAGRRLPRRVADVLGQLSLKRTLQQPPRELPEQPVGPGDLLRRLRAGEQLVDQLV